MTSPNITSKVPTIDRKVDSLPRRSASETWTPISALFRTILREHPRASEIAVAFNEIRDQLPQLFVHHAVKTITLRCGSILWVAVRIQYLRRGEEEHFDPPLALPPELATALDLSLVIEIALDDPLIPIDQEPAFVAGGLIPVYLAASCSTESTDPPPWRIHNSKEGYQSL